MVRFKADDPGKWTEDDKDTNNEGHFEAAKPTISPVTIWIGVFPDSISATTAHNAAQVVLALLKDYQITDVDIKYRESLYTCKAGLPLFKPIKYSALDPLVDLVTPLTPALGLSISTKARPDVQGTMAVYLAEGGNRNRLLGLLCHHVLIGHKEGNINYVCHPSGPPRDVILLSKKALNNLMDTTTSRMQHHGKQIERWREELEETEESADALDAEEVKSLQNKLHSLLEEANKEVKALKVLYDLIQKEWTNIDKCAL